MFQSQSTVCAAFGSPFYAGLTAAVAADLAPPVRALFDPWAGQSFQQLMDAAVSLRFLGALHDLALSGDPALTATFPPSGDDAVAAWRAARAAIERHDARLAAFMAHEPQTNEVRRSVCLLPGVLTVAAETGLPLRCLEVGASAGLNQLWDRFRYRLGDLAWGAPDAPLELQTDWSGPPPPLDAPIHVLERRACDRAPIDVADPAQRRRLKAYLWPDQLERIARFDAAADMAIGAGVRVEAADAVGLGRAQCRVARRRRHRRVPLDLLAVPAGRNASRAHRRHFPPRRFGDPLRAAGLVAHGAAHRPDHPHRAASHPLARRARASACHRPGPRRQRRLEALSGSCRR